jgi:hypothetical protein
VLEGGLVGPPVRFARSDFLPPIHLLLLVHTGVCSVCCASCRSEAACVATTAPPASLDVGYGLPVFTQTGSAGTFALADDAFWTGDDDLVYVLFPRCWDWMEALVMDGCFVEECSTNGGCL